MSLEDQFEHELKHNASVDSIAALIQSGLDVNYLYEEYITPLDIAIYENRLDIVQLLVQSGANPNLLHEMLESEENDEDIFDSSPPIIGAASRDYQDIFDFLAPLTKAENRRLATMQITEAKGAKSKFDKAEQLFLTNLNAQILQDRDLNEPKDNGVTLIWTAAHNGYLSSVDLLIQNEIDINFLNHFDGWTPLMIAAGTHTSGEIASREFWGEQYSQRFNIVRLLLEAGADPNLASNDGRTPLMEACRTGAIDVVRLLLEFGVDVNERDTQNRTALIMVALTTHGWDIDFPQENWGELIYDFSEYLRPQQVEIARILLEYGADIHIPMVGSQTPLIAAAASGSGEIVRLLLEAGSELEIVDEYGKNASDYASQYLRNDVIRVFQAF